VPNVKKLQVPRWQKLIKHENVCFNDRVCLCICFVVGFIDKKEQEVKVI